MGSDGSKSPAAVLSKKLSISLRILVAVSIFFKTIVELRIPSIVKVSNDLRSGGSLF